jgi:hypothetical protein
LLAAAAVVAVHALELAILAVLGAGKLLKTVLHHTILKLLIAGVLELN